MLSYRQQLSPFAARNHVNKNGTRKSWRSCGNQTKLQRPDIMYFCENVTHENDVLQHVLQFTSFA